MCTADVFVLPSVTNAETFGIAQLEAMAAGRPIINTSLDTAVPRVARHGIEAITVPPGNHAQLAEAIETLLRDPERRRRMGHAARLRATTQYSIDAFRKGIETVYRHAVTTKASSRSALASRPGTIGTGPENRHC
jgi:glycosyltransferase involved in cell wall biosynthesis